MDRPTEEYGLLAATLGRTLAWWAKHRPWPWRKLVFHLDAYWHTDRAGNRIGRPICSRCLDAPPYSQVYLHQDYEKEYHCPSCGTHVTTKGKGPWRPRYPMDWDEVERQEIAHIEKARQELRQYREQQKQQQQELEAHRQRLAQSVAGKYVVRR